MSYSYASLKKNKKKIFTRLELNMVGDWNSSSSVEKNIKFATRRVWWPSYLRSTYCWEQVCFAFLNRKAYVILSISS